MHVCIFFLLCHFVKRVSFELVHFIFVVVEHHIHQSVSGGAFDSTNSKVMRNLVVLFKDNPISILESSHKVILMVVQRRSATFAAMPVIVRTFAVVPLFMMHRTFAVAPLLGTFAMVPLIASTLAALADLPGRNV
jgi:hypothetical protein